MIDTATTENTTALKPSSFKVMHGENKEPPAYLDEYYKMQRDKLELI
jgi:hypothetical protein